MFEGCHLYGMPFERKEEVEEARAFDPYRYPLYWRMHRHTRYRRWPYRNWGW